LDWRTLALSILRLPATLRFCVKDPPLKMEIQKSKMLCHGSWHALSRQMSRVKPQKPLAKSEIVTVSRVKTPGEVSHRIAAPRPVRRGEESTERGQLTNSNFSPGSDPRLFAVIRAYLRLFAASTALAPVSNLSRI
jgi:hypothetical protein